METSEPKTLVYASIGSRFVALLIDSIIVGIISSILSLGVQQSQNVLTIILGLAYYTYFIGNSGQTLGAQLLKIKVVMQDGQHPDYQTAGIRYLVSIVSGAVLLIGYLWAFFNPKVQTWHDLAAKTFVIKA